MDVRASHRTMHVHRMPLEVQLFWGSMLALPFAGVWWPIQLVLVIVASLGMFLVVGSVTRGLSTTRKRRD